MDLFWLSKLIHEFVKVWLSKLIHEFVKVVTWICQSCSMYFFSFAKQNQAEVWPRFQSLMHLNLNLLKSVTWGLGLDLLFVLI